MDKFSPEKLIEHYKIAFVNSPVSLSILTDLVADLFTYGDTPEQQARANRSLEILERCGLVEFQADHKTPTMESVYKLLQKLL